MFLSAWAGTGLVGILFALASLIAPLRWCARIPVPARRVVASVILVLVLNGMTTPGIFQDWNVNVLAYIAVLAYARMCVREAAVAPVPAEAFAWPPSTVPA